MEELKQLRVLVSEFQLETRSGDVLLFLQWLQNKIQYNRHCRIPTRADVAQKIIDELRKKEGNTKTEELTPPVV